MQKIRVGVIGVGNMGERHCRIYSTLPHVNFVGLADLAESRGRLLHEKYEVAYYRDFNEMLDQVDAVSIATTTPGHYPIGMQCLQAGKDVLIEKPIALNIQQARELTELAHSTGRVLAVGHIERYNPVFIELHELLTTIPTNNILAVNFRRLSPFDTSQTDVDVVSDLMIHDLDLVLHTVGRAPESIEAFGRSVFTAQIDYAVATLSYNSGLIVNLTASRVTQQKVRAVEVTTGDSYIETDLLNKSLSIHRRVVPHYTSQDMPKYRQEGFIERIYVPAKEPLQLELAAFIDAVRARTAPQVTAQDGTNALALALAIRDRIECKTGLSVTVPGRVPVVAATAA